MRRRILVVILVIVAIAAIGTSAGFGAYHVGYDNGLADSGNANLGVTGGHWHGYPAFGFFPGFFLFPVVGVLIIIAIVSRHARHRGPWGWGPRGEVPAGCAPYGPRAVFDDWHRQAHAGQNQTPGNTTGQNGEGTAA
jgi:hypothetical protein